MRMKKELLSISIFLLVLTYQAFSQDIVSGGSNSWILHTPDDGRTSMFVAPLINNDWAWQYTTQFLNNGGVIFSGNVGIGTTSPYYQLHIKDGNGLSIQASNAQLVMSDISSGMIFRMDNRGNLELLNNALTPLFHFDKSGKLGLGTTSPAYQLDVCGTIRATEVKVDLLGGCDFVFKPNYKLMDLKTLELFIKTNQHLPEIASEKEMVDNGINMKEMQMKLLQKMEEMTLYIIEQNKKNEQQSEKIEQQNQEMKVLKEKIEKREKTSE